MVTEMMRRKFPLALTGLGVLCALVLVGPGTAPSQTGSGSGFLICAKKKKPNKGALRMPSNGICRGGERGLFVNQVGPQGPAGTPGGPPGPQGPPGAPGAPCPHTTVLGPNAGSITVCVP